MTTTTPTATAPVPTTTRTRFIDETGETRTITARHCGSLITADTWVDVFVDDNGVVWLIEEAVNVEVITRRHDIDELLAMLIDIGNHQVAGNLAAALAVSRSTTWDAP